MNARDSFSISRAEALARLKKAKIVATTDHLGTLWTASGAFISDPTEYFGTLRYLQKDILGFIRGRNV